MQCPCIPNAEYGSVDNFIQLYQIFVYSDISWFDALYVYYFIILSVYAAHHWKIWAFYFVKMFYLIMRGFGIMFKSNLKVILLYWYKMRTNLKVG